MHRSIKTTQTAEHYFVTLSLFRFARDLSGGVIIPLNAQQLRDKMHEAGINPDVCDLASCMLDVLTIGVNDRN